MLKSARGMFLRAATKFYFPTLALIIASTISGTAGADDYDQGLKAFRSGDAQQALKDWQPLALSGDARAQHALGMMHEYGRGLMRDDTKAASWYRKAAEQGMPEAQYRLGVLHENGWGVTPDAKIATHWYKRAAALGHVFAQHDLALMYLKGEGIDQSGVHAYKWLKIASTQRPDLMEKHLRRVAQTLNARELREAEALALAWLRSQEI